MWGRMQKWSKILTVAAFVLGGLMLYPPVFANYIQQGQDNGWLNSGCSNTNAYFSTSLGCGTGTALNAPLYSMIYTASGTLSSFFGSFSQVSSVTFTVNNSKGTSITSYATLYCNNPPGSTDSESSNNAVIPTGTSDVTFTWATPMAACNGNSTFMESFINTPSTGDEQYVSFRAINSATSPFATGQAGGQINDSYSPKIALNGGFLPPLGISSPTNLQQVAANNALVVSGACLHPGTNKLAITTVERFSEMMSSGDFSSLNYNIDCKSDYTYTTTYPETVAGQTGLVIVDSTDGTNTSVLFTVVGANFKNALWLNYPPVANGSIYKIKSGLDELQFGYNEPNSSASSSLLGLMLFSLAKCTDNTYNICTPVANPTQQAISDLDSTQSGFFEYNATSTESTDSYYQAILNLSTGYSSTSTQIQIGGVNFDLYGDDTSIYGNTPTGLNITQNDFLLMLQNKFPFAYAMQILNIFNGLANENTTASLAPVTLSFYLPNGSPVNATTTVHGGAALTALPVEIINQDEMYKIMPKPTWDFLKVLEGAAMIFGTAWAIWGRIKSWKHGNSGV